MQMLSTLFGGIVLAGAAYVITDPLFEPHEIHLDLAALEYVVIDGKAHVRQRVISSSGRIVPAAWSASIERDEGGVTTLLCTGSGVGNYNGETSTWSLDDWTGGNCPDLALPGDVFEVSWTYENHHGYRVTIGGRYVLVDGELVPA